MGGYHGRQRHDGQHVRALHFHRPVDGLIRPTRLRTRRLFLAEIGRATIGLAFAAPLIAACGSDDSKPATSDSGPPSGSQDEPAGSSTSEQELTEQQASAGSSDQADQLRWGRTELGFVSAYVLARGNRAAIVDTGTAGSATAIGKTLQEMGLTYDDVDHLILTHRHGDHAGSTGEVLELATGATVYAGQADIEGIEGDGFDRDAISPLRGGEDIFGFETIATPGHTPGHMAVIDRVSGLLVAGDAIFTENGAAIEGPERFFDDIPQSQESIRKLAEFTVNTLLVGHGDPIEQGAGTAITELAAQLPS